MGLDASSHGISPTKFVRFSVGCSGLKWPIDTSTLDIKSVRVSLFFSKRLRTTSALITYSPLKTSPHVLREQHHEPTKRRSKTDITGTLVPSTRAPPSKPRANAVANFLARSKIQAGDRHICCVRGRAQITPGNDHKRMQHKKPRKHSMVLRKVREGRRGTRSLLHTTLLVSAVQGRVRRRFKHSRSITIVCVNAHNTQTRRASGENHRHPAARNDGLPQGSTCTCQPQNRKPGELSAGKPTPRIDEPSRLDADTTRYTAMRQQTPCQHTNLDVALPG